MTGLNYLSPAQVAQRLNVTIATVRKYIAAGKFPTIKVGAHYRVPAKWLQDWLEGAVDDWQGRKEIERRKVQEHEEAVEAFLAEHETPDE